MKIGIMTFWGTKDNYGQVLQCYALQQYLKSLGHEPYLIRYRRELDYIKDSVLRRFIKVFNPQKLYSYLHMRKRQKLANDVAVSPDRGFDAFYEKYIDLSEQEYFSFKELKENPPKADCYIVGSDQVWNFFGLPAYRCINQINAMFLNFGDSNVKRVAYAASWGQITISNEYKNEIIPLLSKFNFVSVREKQGVQLCKQCEYNDAKWLCDPTLLLTADDYRKLYNSGGKIDKPKNPYLLFYYLDNGGNFKKKSVFDFAKFNNLDVVYITANMTFDKFQKKYATIYEWLSLIDGAEYVVTNSFHCCVFSIIFNKKFGAIKLKGQGLAMNSRLSSLFELCNIKDRYIYEDDFSVLNDVPKSLSNTEFILSVNIELNNFGDL